MPRNPVGLLALATATIALGAMLVACGGSNGTSTPGAKRGAASQVTATLRMGSGSAAVGQEATVQLQALGVGQPGLGAWTLNIAYDKKIVSASSCEAQLPPSVCNPKYDDHTVRIAGASGTGVRGDTQLVSVVFTCKASGTSPLHVSTPVFADGTIGGPLPINPTVEDGTITCT